MPVAISLCTVAPPLKKNVFEGRGKRFLRGGATVHRVVAMCKIEQKCLEILFLLYNLHIFAPDQTKEDSNNMFLSFC